MCPVTINARSTDLAAVVIVTVTVSSEFGILVSGDSRLTSTKQSGPGRLLMPIEITTPFPTLDETAKQLGVSKQHARHIEQLVLGNQDKTGTRKAAGRGSGGTRRGSGPTAKRYTKKPK